MKKKLIQTSIGNLIFTIDSELRAININDKSTRNKLTSLLLSEILTYQYIYGVKE